MSSTVNRLDRVLRPVPSPRAMVWGSRLLADALGRPLPDQQPYGESWEASTHPRHHSQVEGETHTLAELMRHHPADLLGPGASAETAFPWLIKWLDCHDWLSVQVHPDAEKVKTLWPGEGSKNEAWFVIAVRPGGKVWAGLKPGVTPEQLRQASLNGTVADLLASFEPKPGDCVHLPAGTVHAVGGGVLMAEVQESSDATFRLFDWNRKDAQGKSRELHLDQSLASIDWTKGPVSPVRADNFPPRPGQASTLRPLVRCPEFHLDLAAGDTPLALPESGTLRVTIQVAGNAALAHRGQNHRSTLGDTLVLPAAARENVGQPQGPAALLVATLPPR
ncbi:MAG: type I phosphomannose isomerase catalytic subunit [Gemmataceae bacterium]